MLLAGVVPHTTLSLDADGGGVPGGLAKHRSGGEYTHPDALGDISSWIDGGCYW